MRRSLEAQAGEKPEVPPACAQSPPPPSGIGIGLTGAMKKAPGRLLRAAATGLAKKVDEACKGATEQGYQVRDHADALSAASTVGGAVVAMTGHPGGGALAVVGVAAAVLQQLPPSPQPGTRGRPPRI